MSRVAGVSLAIIAFVAASSCYAQTSAAPAQAELVKKYCATCHNERAKAGALVLEKLDLENLASHGAVWEKVIRKLATGAMPPQGMPRPDQPALDSLTTYLATSLDAAAKASPNPGRPVLNRLNRAQYANAIHDLPVALDIDVASLLPADDGSFGFDNVGTGLGLSPALIERYVAAAAKISRLAVGETDISAATETYTVPADRSQDTYQEGLPLGTRGGAAFRHNFPLDAEYTIKIGLARNTLGAVIGLDSIGEQLEIAIDGQRVGLFTIDKKTAEALEVRVPVKAGPRVITAAFPERTLAPSDSVFQPFERTIVDVVDARGLPHAATLTIRGPFNTAGPGDTPTRRKIFIFAALRPAPTLYSCAKRILSSRSRAGLIVTWSAMAIWKRCSASSVRPQ